MRSRAQVGTSDERAGAPVSACAQVGRQLDTGVAHDTHVDVPEKGAIIASEERSSLQKTYQKSRAPMCTSNMA
eukprot:5633348-Pyramimonas_sp.AAC.1